MSGDAPSMSEKIELFAASSYTIKRKSAGCLFPFVLSSICSAVFSLVLCTSAHRARLTSLDFIAWRNK